MESYIANGRSTAGPAQEKEFDLSITGDGGKDKRRNTGAKTEAECSREMDLAFEPSFD